MSRAKELLDKVGVEVSNRKEAMKIDPDAYVEYDSEFDQYCVYGEETGFCYHMSNTDIEAEEYLKTLIPTLNHK